MAAHLSHKSHDLLIADLKGQACTVGLLTTAPEGDGSGVVEPNVIYGYSRQPITFGPTERAGVKSIIKNAVPMVFGAVSAMNWPTVTHIALFDADGDLRAYSPLAASRTAPIGDTVSFGAEAVQFRFN